MNYFNISKNFSGIFENDIGNQMTIGVSDKGYRSVQLKCGSNSMLVALETEKDFDGVIYTRGNFTDKNSACFLDSSSKRGKKSFSLKFPLDQCNTKKAYYKKMFCNTILQIYFRMVKHIQTH